jgi:hypothetical protein
LLVGADLAVEGAGQDGQAEQGEHHDVDHRGVEDVRFGLDEGHLDHRDGQQAPGQHQVDPVVQVAAEQGRGEDGQADHGGQPGGGGVGAQAEDPVGAAVGERLAPGDGEPDDAEEGEVQPCRRGEQTVGLPEVVVEGVVRHQADCAWRSRACRGGPVCSGGATLL